MRVFLETKSPRNSWDICQLRWMEAERSYEFKLLLTPDSVSAMLNCFRLKSQVCCPCLKCNLNKHTAPTAWDLSWNPPKRMIQHQECVTTQATAPTVRRAHRKTGQLQRHKICAAYLLTRFIVETPRKMCRTHVVPTRGKRLSPGYDDFSLLLYLYDLGPEGSVVWWCQPVVQRYKSVGVRGGNNNNSGDNKRI